MDNQTELDQIEQNRRANRAFSFLGFEIRRKPKELEPDQRPEKIVSPVAPQEENDPAYLTTGAGYFGQVLDVRGDFGANDRDLIVKYRNAAMQPECDDAIEDIVNEAIVADDENMPVTLNLDKVKQELLEDETRELMLEEFDNICTMLDFTKYGHDIFRRWYIDGRVAFHKVIDLNNPKKGIVELRPMNPTNLQKVREYDDRTEEKTGTQYKEITDEYFLYSESAFSTDATKSNNISQNGVQHQAVKLPVDSVAYVTSGVLDASRRMPLSYLHKALRSVNQLRYMEDALVINRLARAPQRRMFYIDVGQMNEKKAMEYVRQIRDKYRNKILYDAKSGEVRSDAKHMSMLEDFWLPRKDGSRGTEISQLPGDDSFENVAPIEYFQKKLYKSMNVPYGRLESASGFNLGRSVEVSREELKFQKFVHRLRKKFAELFKDMLKTQCVLKGILTLDEWDSVKEKIIIDYEKDSYFTELKEAEIWRERITTLNEMREFIGEFFSEEWILKKILRMNDQDILEMRKQIYDEAIRRRTDMPIPKDEDNTGDGGAGGSGGPTMQSPGGGNNPTPGGENKPGDTPSPGGGTTQAPSSNTGLKGINKVAAPPPEPEEGEEGEEGAEPSNEPQLNTGVDFPEFEEPAGPRWKGDGEGTQQTRGEDQGRRRVVKRRASGQGRDQTGEG